MRIGPLNISFSRKDRLEDTGNVGGIQIPRGRRSEDPLTFKGLVGKASTYFGGVDPKFPIEFLDIIAKACLAIPDFSQALSNVVHIGNNGHQLVITASPRRLKRAHERLNDLADRIKTEVVINRMIRQMGINGALSIEWAPKLNLSGLETYAMVPVRSIRFEYDEERLRYVPYQLGTDGRKIELNETTYIYSALEQDENCPYGIPPFIAALPPAMIQIDMMENIKFAMKKLGLLGVTDIVVKPPQRMPGETDADLEARSKTMIEDIAGFVGDKYYDGIMVHFDTMSIEHHGVSADARGAKDILQMNEEQVMSGLKQAPAMLGRTYSTTETYGEVVYNKMINEIDGYRRLVSHAMETGYQLELLMAGIDAEVRFEFAGNSSFQPKEQAETALITTQTAVQRMDAGLISPDQAANEIGYEEAYQQGLPPDTGDKQFATLVFKDGRYVHKRDRIELSGHGPFVEAFLNHEHPAEGPKIDRVELASEKGIERRRLRWVNDYVRKVKAVDDKAKGILIGEIKQQMRTGKIKAYSANEFASQIYEYLAVRYPAVVRREGLKDVIKVAVSNVYGYYRFRDKVMKKEIRIARKMVLPDVRAVNFLRKLDDFYLSKYLGNEAPKKQILDYLSREYLEGGYSDIDKFAERFSKHLSHMSKPQIERMVDTSVSRARNAGHIRQMAQYGAKVAEVVEVMDSITCPICAEMDGKTFRVKGADDRLKELYSLSPEEFHERVYENAPSDWKKDPAGYGRKKSGDQMVDENIVGPPYHPRCRGRLRES